MFKKTFLITSVLFFTTIPGSACAQGILDFTRVMENSSYEEWEESFKAAKHIYKDFCVDSVEEFIKITEYYNEFISDGKIVHSFRTIDSEDIYCIDVYSQNSIRANGLDPSDLTFAPQSIPDEFEEKIDNPDTQLKTIDFGLDGSLDENGNARQCPKGSFPKLIPKLENLYKFKYLENLFKKYPVDDSQCNFSSDSKASLSASANSSEHVYAHAYQRVNHRGLRAEFNLWSPDVQGERDFSLSQLWVSRGDRDSNELQTVETGWQEYEYLYGDKKSRLFVYYTPDSYSTGCYNLLCEAFVQVDSSIVVGGSFSIYSTIGGDQYSVELMFMRDESPPHHWWLKVYDAWVGYYPNTLFNSQGIADHSDLADLGGEIFYYPDGEDFTSTDMGSGRFPHEGFKYAAYIKGIKYVDMDFQYRDPDKLAERTTYPNYYDIDLWSSEDENWGSYFYFGEPGKVTGQTSTSTTIIPTTSVLPSTTTSVEPPPTTTPPTPTTTPPPPSKTTTTTMIPTTTTTIGISIKDHALTKEPSVIDTSPQGGADCESPSRDYSFSTNDEAACSWVMIDGILSGDKIKWEWYSPDAELYFDSSFIFEFDGTGCSWHCIYIHDWPPVDKLGDWQADVYYNGTKQFTEHFTISGAGSPPPTTCPTEQIYGEHSEETQLLRYIRDNVLIQTPEGQEIIRLYYQWSPSIVQAMEEDEEFKEEVKEMVDGVLELIGE
jgi:hypothetical protein